MTRLSLGLLLVRLACSSKTLIRLDTGIFDNGEPDLGVSAGVLEGVFLFDRPRACISCDN